MEIKEYAMDEELLDDIQSSAEEAAKLLELDIETASAGEIVRAVDHCVFEMQKGKQTKFPDEEPPEYLLGGLWGEQLVKALGWEWAEVEFPNVEDAKAIGVFSKDRALAIFPFHYIYGCLENDAEVAIELSFDILVDGNRVPKLPERGYENVMEHVHHDPPRE